jgi:hypothetical protein
LPKIERQILTWSNTNTNTMGTNHSKFDNLQQKICTNSLCMTSSDKEYCDRCTCSWCKKNPVTIFSDNSTHIDVAHLDYRWCKECISEYLEMAKSDLI